MIETVLALALQTAPAAERPRVKQWPSAYEGALAYPALANAEKISGRATLRCRVNGVGGLADCAVKEETPTGKGFGKAAMSLRSKVRMHKPAPGADPWTEITFAFDGSKTLKIY